ncbi:response regulator [Salinisphaera sp. PC39]|uniref:response regulator transcription factor n=1 Tax=Salinisphaera sp. PC39 TaxID=1304156 RepID=UPI00333FD0C8
MSGGETGPLVYVVDDDDAVRDSLRLLFKSVDMPVRIFADAESFLAGLDRGRPGCLVCDVRMPGTGGLELQARMEADGLTTPIIFITGHGDVPMAVDAMRKGAVDFLQKPFDDDDLLDRVRQALSGDTDHPD